MTIQIDQAAANGVQDDQAELQHELVRARLQHLFRNALTSGRLNPLMHIVQHLRLQELQ